MLSELKVENLALIESLHLRFDTRDGSSLVVMTGETGAGKSIMLRAIQMLTGGRASTDWIRSGADQCVVEALFEVRPEHHQFLNKLNDSGFGRETEIIIKRIIGENGKSRIYINGSLATAKVTRELTEDLLNVASQHDQQQLLQPGLHLNFLDTLGEHWQERDALALLYREYNKKCAVLDGLRKKEQDKEKKRDLLAYQLSEIENAALVIGEDEELAAERKKLKSCDALIQLSGDCYGRFTLSLLDELSLIRKNIMQIAELDPGAATLAEDICSYCFSAEDLVMRLREYRDSVDTDPFRLEQVVGRIDLVQSLKRKYGTTIESVLEYAKEAAVELERLDTLEIQMSSLEKEVQDCMKKLTRAARQLSEQRKETAGIFEKAMDRELSSLAFRRAAIEVRWQEREDTIDEIGPSGWDRVEFFFTANPGEPARPLAKVASGGELSRLMLALKCLLAKKDMVDTVIFDEVDAGIGGEAAEAVARKIQELAGHHQVFCITHLPQIAARGTDHYLVRKSENNGRTLSSIAMLKEEERGDEVARMLAGESATDQTHAWAKELLRKSRVEWQKK